MLSCRYDTVFWFGYYWYLATIKRCQSPEDYDLNHHHREGIKYRFCT
jgi:hypothetical protein